MKYTTLYNKIQNPLEDPQVLEQLIEAYAEGDSFYTALTNRFSKNKKLVYNKQSRDELHASIFNRWKKELLSITTEQYNEAIKNGLYKNNIFKLIGLLKTVPDVATEQEAMAILNKAYQDKELEEAMEEYRWDSIGAYSGWTHISERYINGKKTITPDIEHRLYINTDLMDVHYMSKIFMDKCIEKKLPFYFKIGECDRRDDDIVIYTDTKYLPHFLGVLKEIEEEYPDLVQRCGKPPILSGVIRNWIGYGSEPLKQTGEESFNGIRAKSIENAIDEELINWYRTHKDVTVKVQGQNISLQEYIVRQVVKTKVKRMLDYRKDHPDNKYIKYTEEDINQQEFVKRMANLVRTKMPGVFNSYINKEKSSVKIEVPIKSGVNTTIYSSNIIKELKKFLSAIKAYDPDFIKRVKKRIEQDATSKGIDPNKYCFDIANVELLRRAEEETATKNNPPANQPAKKQEIKPSVDETQKYKRPTGTPMSYKSMTDEDIRASQQKLAECPMVKVKKK